VVTAPVILMKAALHVLPIAEHAVSAVTVLATPMKTVPHVLLTAVPAVHVYQQTQKKKDLAVQTVSIMTATDL